MVEASTELRYRDVHIVVKLARSKILEWAERAGMQGLSQRLDILEIESVFVTPLEPLR